MNSDTPSLYHLMLYVCFRFIQSHLIQRHQLQIPLHTVSQTPSSLQSPPPAYASAPSRVSLDSMPRGPTVDSLLHSSAANGRPNHSLLLLLTFLPSPPLANRGGLHRSPVVRLRLRFTRSRDWRLEIRKFDNNKNKIRSETFVAIGQRILVTATKDSFSYAKLKRLEVTTACTSKL